MFHVWLIPGCLGNARSDCLPCTIAEVPFAVNAAPEWGYRKAKAVVGVPSCVSPDDQYAG